MRKTHTLEKNGVKVKVTRDEYQKAQRTAKRAALEAAAMLEAERKAAEQAKVAKRTKVTPLWTPEVEDQDKIEWTKDENASTEKPTEELDVKPRKKKAKKKPAKKKAKKQIKETESDD